MIKAIIIDDEPLARMLLREMLSEYETIEIIAECNDGFEGLKSIQDLNPDLIFLDIQMPKITGFEMLELIPNPPKVVFTTAYDEYAIKAFEVNAVDYLLKPYSSQRLAQTMQKIKESLHTSSIDIKQPKSIHTPESQHRIVVKDNNIIKIIPTDDVYYIEAAADYARITLKDKFYLKHGTMQKFEEQLPIEKFMRIHRSFIINIHHLLRVELYENGNGHCVVMKNEAVLPISKTGFQKIKSYLS